MINNQQHMLAAESQFASGCLCNTAFAKAFSEIWVTELSVVKALDWLVPFSRDYVKKYNDAPGLDALPYVEAAIRSCDLPEEAMGFFVQAAKNPPRNTEALLARAQKHYHLLSRQRHADRIHAAIMADDEEGIAEADLELKKHKVGVEKWGDGVSILDKRGNQAMFDSLPRPIIRLPGYAGTLLNPRLTLDALVVGIASAKVGKTASSVCITGTAAMQGNKCVFITIGDDKDPRIRRRFYSFLSGRPVVGEYDEALAQTVPIVVCKRGAKGECKMSCGTCLSPFPNEKVFAETQPEELLAKYPDFVPCRECWRNGKADHADFEPMIWWMKHSPTPILPADADEATDAIAALIPGNGGVDIAYRPKRVLTVEGLNDMLDRRADMFGRPDDVVTIDYPDMMKLPRGTKDYEQMQEVWEELRNIAADRNILILAVTQTNRSGGIIETQTMETTGRSKTVLDNCSCAFSVNQTAPERAMGVMRVSIMAGREPKFAPEHQAMCCSWLHVQDPFAESFHVYRKIKEVTR
jgi:hypothetical protein